MSHYCSSVYRNSSTEPSIGPVRCKQCMAGSLRDVLNDTPSLRKSCHSSSVLGMMFLPVIADGRLNVVLSRSGIPCERGGARRFLYLAYPSQYHSNGLLKSSPVTPQYRLLKSSAGDVVRSLSSPLEVRSALTRPR